VISVFLQNDFGPYYGLSMLGRSWERLSSKVSSKCLVSFFHGIWDILGV